MRHHTFVNVTSRLTIAQGETRVDKGLRGHWRNTPSHLSLILEGYFQSCSLEVDVSHAPVMFRREVFSGHCVGHKGIR